MPPLIRIGPEICRDPEKSLRLEWLETNGIGGFANSTLAGANSRRQHGLLVAPIEPAGRRFVLLSKLEETLRVDDCSWEVSSNVYTDTIHPRGYLLLSTFSLDPFPTFTFSNGAFELRKVLLLPQGENAALIRYELVRAAGPVQLEIRPLIAFRSFDDLTFENSRIRGEFFSSGNRAILEPYPGLPPLQIAHNASSLQKTGYWYRSLRYSNDPPSTQPSCEDLFNPFVMHFDLSSSQSSWLLASTRLGAVYPETVASLLELEAQRRRSHRSLQDADSPADLELLLSRAADQFLVRQDKGGAGVISGFARLDDRSRDAMIALPGLTLSTGRTTEARKILRTFAAKVTARSPEAADLGLWFAHAVSRYLRYTGDIATVEKEYYPAVKAAIGALRHGLHPDARMDGDGLLVTCATLGRFQPAADDEFGGPPRHKLVEVQALWHHALSVATFLSQSLEGTRVAREFSRVARLCRRSFIETFWNAPDQCLFDSIRDGVPDSTVRAYQILAAGLADSMLDRNQQRKVVRRVEEDLLGPYGLRLEASKDRQDAPGGEGAASDARRVASVWLLGPYAAAYRQAFGESPDTSAYVRKLMDPPEKFLAAGIVGSIPEAYRADPPSDPCGSWACARSVAELLLLSKFARMLR